MSEHDATPAQFDPGPILAALDRHAVQYVLVGGYAAALHGAKRPTQDVDITPATDIENMTRLISALHELGAGIRVDAEPDPLPFNADPATLAVTTTLNLRTPHGDLDLTMRPDGTDGYSELAEHAGPHPIGTLTVQLASLDDIIRSKEAAGRTKDAEALPELYQLAGRHPAPTSDAPTGEPQRRLTPQERISRAHDEIARLLQERQRKQQPLPRPDDRRRDPRQEPPSTDLRP